jgi:excisionase family DNA binding protein
MSMSRCSTETTWNAHKKHRMDDDRTARPPKRTRVQRLVAMERDIPDVPGAAALLGVSARTIDTLARQGALPATRIGRVWRFARTNLRAWVANGSQADQRTTALRQGRVGPRRRWRRLLATATDTEIDLLVQHAFLVPDGLKGDY